MIMKKLMLGSLLGLFAFGFTRAQAQYFPPVTTPYVRPPFFPYSGTPGALNPYGGLFGGYPFGGTPYGGYPYGGTPYGTSPYGTGPYGSMTTGIPGSGFASPAGGIAPVTAVGLNDPNVTGHPTRFMSYSRYFFNQGGALAAPLPGTRPILGANPNPLTPVIGTAPPRGRANTAPGGR
jgi:hypothetical protein